MKTMFETAYELTKEVHKNQTRWDKKTPYIVHIDAVIDNVKKNNPNHDRLDILMTVAALHDAHEDHRHVTFEHIMDVLLESGADPDHVFEVMVALDAITEKETKDEESYLDYILRIKKSPIATLVKIADIQHNMSDLKKGSMKEKYLLAIYILQLTA